MMLTKALHTNCNTNKEMREDKNDVMTFFFMNMKMHFCCIMSQRWAEKTVFIFHPNFNKYE